MKKTIILIATVLITSNLFAQKATYTFKGKDKEETITITKTPKRLALFTPYMTEIAMALGLEDKIVFGSKESDVLSQFKRAYNKIPNKQIGHGIRLTKEEFLLLRPDFFSSNFNPEATGTTKELKQKGIAPFIPNTISKQNATLKDVYADILLLGKIFNVEKKANEIVEKMKLKLLQKQKDFKNKPDAQKPKVMVMAKLNNGTTIFSSLTTDLINKANGKNVFEEVSNRYKLVPHKEVLEKNPDVIFIIDVQSKGVSVEAKKEYLKRHPILKNVSAVKNNKVYGINMSDVSPSTRNVDFIIKMNELIYKK